VETAALWKPWKNKLRFSTAPTALGKLANNTRVFHSSHSHYYRFNKNWEKAKPLIAFINYSCTSKLNPRLTFDL
jgi:hypothetical protein